MPHSRIYARLSSKNRRGLPTTCTVPAVATVFRNPLDWAVYPCRHFAISPKCVSMWHGGARAVGVIGWSCCRDLCSCCFCCGVPFVVVTAVFKNVVRCGTPTAVVSLRTCVVSVLSVTLRMTCRDRYRVASECRQWGHNIHMLIRGVSVEKRRRHTTSWEVGIIGKALQNKCEGVTYWAIIGVKDRSITQPEVILIPKTVAITWYY